MQPNQQLTASDGTVLDPKVLRVMKAIRQNESSNADYGAVGDGGDAHGAFQYNEKTGPGWKNIARQYLGDENAPMDKANQNKATYLRIKEWKDKDFQPEEIAALWNGASKGPNGRYVCNNPDYCRRFLENLMGGQQTNQAVPPLYQQQQGQVPSPMSTGGGLEQPPTLEQTKQKLTATRNLEVKEPNQVDTRLDQGFEGLGKLATGAAELNLPTFLSGGIQTAGAAAGGIVDVTDAALGMVPGYDATMDFVGKKVIAPLFGAAGGGKAVEKWQEYATQYPEAAKNIAAMGNIVSVFPLFKVVRTGVGAVADGIKGSVAKTGFIKSTEDAAKNEIRMVAGQAPKASQLIFQPTKVKGKTVDPVDTLVDNDYLPDVVQNPSGVSVYDSTSARKKIQDNLDADDNLLEQRLQDAMRQPLAAPTLATGRTMAGDATRAGYYAVSDMRKEMADAIENRFKSSLNVPQAKRKMDNLLDSLEGSYGQYVPLTLMREIKSGVRTGVKYADPKEQALEKEVRKEMGQVFMKKIEDMAEERGLDDVAEISGRMQANFRADDVLRFINGRKVAERSGLRGMIGRQGSDIATVAGEAAGQMTGTLGVGGLIARKVANRALGGSAKSVVGKLKSKRTRRLPSKLQTGAALGVLQTRHLQENQSEQTQP